MPSPNLQEVLAHARMRLEEMGTDQPRLESEILLRHVLEIGTREFLLLDRADPLSSPLAVRFEELLTRRLAHEPLQYILGSVQFCEFDFRVGPGVLIPRPETEVLVETVSRYIKKDLGPNGTLVDVGTGAGAIAISLLARFPEWLGIGLDLSSAALGYARENARRVLANTDTARASGSTGSEPAPMEPPRSSGLFRFLPVQADLTGCCRPAQHVGQGEPGPARPNLIVSNPPYIPSREIPELAAEVREREPRMALDGGEDGMDCTRLLVSDSARVLRSGGLLCLELALGQSNSIRSWAERVGFNHLETYRDLTGRERGLILRRN